ncbi:MAG TPA: MaoC family dehydratase [Sphingomonas sp.]|jgi:acyl dehydratase
MLYFEDVEVGAIQRFGAYRVTREEVVEFAGRYDPQPFHLSDEQAARTHFGRLSASGWHTCAMTMSMIVANLQEQQVAGVESPGIDELRWLRPVHPGDTLSCETEVLEKRASQSRPEMGISKSRMTVFNQDGAPVMTFISTHLTATRPTATVEAGAHPS